MADVMLSLLLAVAVCIGAAAALTVMARFVGLGVCMECQRTCPPWDAYCWRHSPDAGDR